MASAVVESENYGRDYKAYSKIDATSHVLSDRAPPADTEWYKFPKPLEAKCPHDFCLQDQQQIHMKPVPLQKVNKGDLVVGFDREN